ncbi:MAG: insulinase family protein, partial [Rhodothermales bacterium]
HRHRIRSLEEALSIALRRELREEMGGVYGVGVRASTSTRPRDEYSLTIQFGCAPDRVDELTSAMFTVLERMKANGPDADVLETVMEQQRRERETQVRTNGFWSSVLEFYYSHEEDVLDVLRYDDLIENLTANDLQEAARTYLDTGRYVEAVLYPEMPGGGPQ